MFCSRKQPVALSAKHLFKSTWLGLVCTVRAGNALLEEISLDRLLVNMYFKYTFQPKYFLQLLARILFSLGLKFHS